MFFLLDGGEISLELSLLLGEFGYYIFLCDFKFFTIFFYD